MTCRSSGPAGSSREAGRLLTWPLANDLSPMLRSGMEPPGGLSLLRQPSRLLLHRQSIIAPPGRARWWRVFFMRLSSCQSSPHGDGPHGGAQSCSVAPTARMPRAEARWIDCGWACYSPPSADEFRRANGDPAASAESGRLASRRKFTDCLRWHRVEKSKGQRVEESKSRKPTDCKSCSHLLTLGLFDAWTLRP